MGTEETQNAAAKALPDGQGGSRRFPYRLVSEGSSGLTLASSAGKYLMSRAKS
jgi:hypothetical protein